MSSKPVVAVGLRGGLGNQLFGWATAFSLSRKVDAELVLVSHKIQRKDSDILDPRSFELGYFGLKESPVQNLRFQIADFVSKTTGKFGADRLSPPVFNEGGFDYDPKITGLSDSIFLDGYFQSWRYFESHRTEILLQLNLRRNVSPETLRMEERIQKEKWIGVHVRRGDYLKVGIMALPGERYYRNAVELAREACGADKVFVFSDDVERARHIVPFANRFIGPESTPRAGDVLHLLSRADSIVGANSSLSWWAAYVSNVPESPKIFPAQWFSDRRKTTPDLVPHNWISLDD